MQSVPVDEDSLSGRRRTRLKGLHENAEMTEIVDDYKEVNEPNRSLQERWLGETWLEIKREAACPPLETAKQRRVTKTQRKRKAQETVPEEDEKHHEEVEELQPEPREGAASSSSGQVLPRVPVISPLTTALRSLGPDAVDGVPERPKDSVETRCSIDACQLPGGHSGPHEDGDGGKFTWTKEQGRVELDEDDAYESSSSEEIKLMTICSMSRRTRPQRRTKMSSMLSRFRLSPVTSSSCRTTPTSPVFGCPGK